MKRPSFRSVLENQKPLSIVGAHDALSARLIEQAGFPAMFIGGFSLVGVRYGVPDIGLKALGEIAAGVKDILDASSLPVFVDADNGYGDAKNVVHTVRTYERLGAGALLLEDQEWPKRCGHMDGKRVIDRDDMVRKVRAAVAAKDDPDLMIFARTDARSVHGLDEALRRAEAYIEAGADGIFVEAPQSIEELEIVGRSFDVPQLANPLEGGKTPLLPPDQYAELGFDLVVYGITLALRVARTMADALADIRSGTFALMDSGATFDEYKAMVGYPEWMEIEGRFEDR